MRPAAALSVFVISRLYLMKEGESKLKESNSGLYRRVKKETFVVDGTCLVVEDRINRLMPMRSERILRIAGTGAYYSVIPLSPDCHRLLCYNYCEDALKIHPRSFYKHALVLGCGGGAVPRWLLDVYPSTVDVVDLSPDIISVCRKYFLNEWEDSERLKYYCADAQKYEPPDYKYQFIFCDMFGGMELVPFVYTRKFAEKLRGMISDDGILIINCGWHHLDEIKWAYKPVFAHLQVLDRKPWQTEVVEVSDSFITKQRTPDPAKKG